MHYSGKKKKKKSLQVTNKISVTKVFGIPNPTAEKATLGPALGCRNAAVGLMLLYLSFNGHRDVIAPLLAFWITCVGLEDVYLGYLYGASIRVHVINIGIGFGVITLLWMT
jgi:hypothetical protein